MKFCDMHRYGKEFATTNVVVWMTTTEEGKKLVRELGNEIDEVDGMGS